MNGVCPYRHIPYSSWRLYTLCNVMLARSSEVFRHESRRSFSTSTSLRRRHPNPNRRGRRRPGAKEARINELETLRKLHSEISEALKNSDGASERPSSAETLTPESDSILPTSTAKCPQQSSPSESLPETFLPWRLGAKERNRKPRPTPEVIERLKLNPWAQALASPVRMCSATGIRLPSDILLEYGMVQHPTNHNIWLLPTGLLEVELQEYKDSSTPVRRNYPVFRLPNAMSIMSEVNSQPRRKGKGGILPHQWRPHFGGGLTNAEVDGAVWRKDMPEYVLRCMRNDAVRKLKGLALDDLQESRSNRFWSTLDVKDGGADGLQEALSEIDGLEYVNWGGVVILDPKGIDYPKLAEDGPADQALKAESTQDTRSTTNPTPSTQSQFPDSVPVLPEGTQVPIFDLTKLLSDEHLEELRSSTKLYQNGALFLRPGRPKAAELLLRLWKLKIYCTI